MINAQTILYSKLINKAELARLMWPGIKNSTAKLDNKINQRAGQRITEADEELIVSVFKKEFYLL